MTSTKESLIKRAKYNGMKSAECDFNHDYRTGKTYSQNTIDLTRAYPMYASELQQAHHAAYIEFNKTHKRP
jgi:hypothetical protein